MEIENRDICPGFLLGINLNVILNEMKISESVDGSVTFIHKDKKRHKKTKESRNSGGRHSINRTSIPYPHICEGVFIIYVEMI